MRVLIAGMDGYLGWPLALHLSSRGHEVYGTDNFLRRKLVNEVGSQSATPIKKMKTRLEHCDANVHFTKMDMTKFEEVLYLCEDFRPEAIVYLSEIPSAPYSMVSCRNALNVHANNIEGTLVILHAMKQACPDAHLVKLGTMGEYGTPNVPIPEGFFDLELGGRVEKHTMFPRKAGSWYHLTKVHDTHNVEFACRNWGLRATDIMQGVVYGTRTDEIAAHPDLMTRFDFDQHFGTAINRFCAQALIGMKLTVYGVGNQTRGFLPLRDSMQCLTIAVEDPPPVGEYRVFNQFEETYSINELAKKVWEAAREIGLACTIDWVENPRIEAENHYYNPVHAGLRNRGYEPTHDMHQELIDIFQDLTPHISRIRMCKDAAWPSTRWDGKHRRSRSE